MKGRTLVVGIALAAFTAVALQWRDKSYFPFLLSMGLIPGCALLAALVAAWWTGLAERRGVAITGTVLCVALLPYLAVLLFLGIPSSG